MPEQIDKNNTKRPDISLKSIIMGIIGVVAFKAHIRLAATVKISGIVFSGSQTKVYQLDVLVHSYQEILK